MSIGEMRLYIFDGNLMERRKVDRLIRSVALSENLLPRQFHHQPTSSDEMHTNQLKGI